MIKVNKAKFIATLKKSLAKNKKIREAKQAVLENGLFVPTRNDLEEEMHLATAYKADSTRNMSDDETASNLC
jgi:hypothetical protein